jgi:mRNA interferase RelE/StbE
LLQETRTEDTVSWESYLSNADWIKKSTIKDLSALPRNVKEKIHIKIADLAKYPDVANIKKLTQFEFAYRLRVGDYRILFDTVNNEKIVIGRILHRKESYK